MSCSRASFILSTSGALKCAAEMWIANFFSLLDLQNRCLAVFQPDDGWNDLESLESTGFCFALSIAAIAVFDQFSLVLLATSCNQQQHVNLNPSLLCSANSAQLSGLHSWSYFKRKTVTPHFSCPSLAVMAHILQILRRNRLVKQSDYFAQHKRPGPGTHNI